MSKKKIIKKGEAPSAEDAASALNIIKLRETQSDEESERRRKLEEQMAIRAELERIEKEKIAIAQEKIKRKLRENLKLKEEEEKKDKLIKSLESGDKISWKTQNNGKLLGYVDDVLLFEISRGLTIFNLYIKDKVLMEKHNLSKSYLGCSSNIQKLKYKSEKLI